MRDTESLRTSINISKDRLEKIKLKASEKNFSYSDLIHLCLEHLIPNLKKDEFNDCTIIYQERYQNWVNAHITLNSNQYDIYYDIKKITRLSFSYLVAMAIDLYAETILNDSIENRFVIHQYYKKFIGDEKLPMYIFYWGSLEKPFTITLPADT
jgi:hypothetical protein